MKTCLPQEGQRLQNFAIAFESLLFDLVETTAKENSEDILISSFRKMAKEMAEIVEEDVDDIAKPSSVSQ